MVSRRIFKSSVPAVLAAFWIICVFAVSLSGAYAFHVEPMEINFTKVGQRIPLRVVNKFETPLTIEIEVYEGGKLQKETANRRRVDDKFVVFPPQGVIEPTATQVFQITYVGDPVAKKLYRILVRQVNVNLKKTTSSGAEVAVKFDFDVKASVAIASQQ